MFLEKTKIYGVANYGAGGALTRTDSAVGLTVTPGTSEIESDFDNCYPWSEMKRVTDDYGNEFIHIPKFYSKLTPNADGTIAIQISGCRHEGFSTLFVDGKGNELDYVWVGAKEGGFDSENNRIVSKSGVSVKVNTTRGNYRTYCRNNGKGYQQLDFLIRNMIIQLFVVEYAHASSQTFMAGFTNGENTAALQTGHTNPVRTASGSYNLNHDLETEPWVDTTCNTDGFHACIYRGMENPWGNVHEWCDGINFKGKKIYLCESPEDYDDDKYDAPYFYVGDRPTVDGNPATMQIFPKSPALMFVKTLGTSKFGDYYWAAETGTVLRCGGHWSRGSSAGLSYWTGSSSASGVASGVGGRLCYKPL